MSNTKFDKSTLQEVNNDTKDLEIRDTASVRDTIFNDLVKSIFVEGKSHKDLANEMGITASDVKQLETTALRAFYTGSVKTKTNEQTSEKSLDLKNFNLSA